MEEKKYKVALERAKSAIKECGNNLGRIKMIESIFSDELWESEEEQTRKQLLDFVQRYTLASYADRDKWVAYLEKLKDIDKRLEDAYKTADEVQYKRGYDKGCMDGYWYWRGAIEELGKQATIKDGNSIDPQFAKPITTTETKYPKFKIGDWVVDEEDNHVYQVKRVVTNVSSGMSGYDLSDGGYFYSTKTNCHLWSIADAKAGDVLAFNDDTIVLFKEVCNDDEFYCYCYCTTGDFGFYSSSPCCWKQKGFFPATKEQCELLFREMEEAGYIWNATTKELSQLSVTKKSDKVWNEEDEENYRNATTIISRQKLNAYTIEMMNDCSRCIDWLSSIKERMN